MSTILSEQFEEHRERLRAIAYRMLGVSSDADDAVQEVWIRLQGSDAGRIDNLNGWLTTVTARVCLNMLRSRRTRREVPFDPHVPDPVVQPIDAAGPEHEAVLADSVGLALLVALDVLSPAERLAFVLHDVFAVPFDEIASMVDRSPEAARKLASRARRRIHGSAIPDADAGRQRQVVNAFFTAARSGDLEALVSVLHPEVALRSDGGSARPVASTAVRGATNVAGRAISFSVPDAVLHPVLVNGGPGVLVDLDGKPVAVMGFTVVAGKVTAIDVLADPERIGRLDLTGIGGSSTS